MAPANFQLVMQSGPTPGKSYPLDKSEIFIGRDINNDIVISDAEISRKHCRLVYQSGGYVIEDLGSTNGCFVNGQRLMGPHALSSGELLMLGENVGLAYEAIGFDINATVVGSSMSASAAPFQDLSGASESAFSAPPVESYGPPQPVQMYAAPAAEAAPSFSLGEAAPVQKGGCRKWFFAGCGCLVVIMCLVVVVSVIVIALQPGILESAICADPLKGITNNILQALGSAYYCP